MAFEMNEMQKVLFDKLKPLQREVALNSLSGMSDIDSYRNSNGKAKTESAQRASVCEILANHNVVTFLDEMKAVAVSDAVMSKQEMMERLSSFARTSLNDLVDWGEGVGFDADGIQQVQSVWTIKPSAIQDLVKMASIAELTAGAQGIKIKQHSPLAAMKQLADLAGYDAPTKTELSGVGGGPIEVKEIQDDELKEKLRSIGLGRYHNQLGSKIVD